MKRFRQTANASALMAASAVVVAVCRFARNVLLARMLLPADLGVGATFSLALMFLEMVTEIGPGKQLVQAKEGGRTAWLRNANTVVAIRGGLVAAALLLLAGPCAAWIGAPETAPAFACLALAPLMRGFEHMDLFRLERSLRMRQQALVTASPAVVSLLAAPVAAWVLRDYRAFLVTTLVAGATRLVMSHALSERAYRLGWSPHILKRFFNFGWPIIGNGLMLFIILHGERFLIAGSFSLDVLGAYSVAATLGFMPAMMLANVHSKVALPVLSGLRDDREAFMRVFASSAQIMCLAAGLLAIPFALSGEWLVATLYGERYLIAQQVIPWIGLMCAIRVVRTTPAMASIAFGQTKIAPLANLSRAASFGVAAYTVSRGWDIAWLPACAFFGELLAYLASLLLLRWRVGIPAPRHLRYSGLTAAVVAAVWFVSRTSGLTDTVSAPVAAGAGCVALVVISLMFWANLRRIVAMLIVPPSRVVGEAS